MHSRELVELAALVAIHAPAMVRESRGVPQASIEQYWVASKCRIDRWLRLLRRLADAGAELPVPAALAWPRVRPVLEEILVSELLTRVWTAASAAFDSQRGDQDLEPIARNIFSAHLDARRRLLQLICDGRAIARPHADRLNRLRRRLERWNDMLLSHLSPLVAIDEFAFDPERARDFADDLRRDMAADQGALTCQLMSASLRNSLASDLADRTPNADLNRRLGSAVLGCFQPNEDPPGLARSFWLDRIARTTNDAQGLIDELLGLDALTPGKLRESQGIF